MTAVSTLGEYTAVKSRRDVCIVSMLSHDACTGSMSNRDVRARTADVTASAKMSTTAADVSATAKMSTTAATVSTAVSCGSLRGK
jgi:hypothetical protein